jgi:hypothetical protein
MKTLPVVCDIAIQWFWCWNLIRCHAFFTVLNQSFFRIQKIQYGGLQGHLNLRNICTLTFVLRYLSNKYVHTASV